MKHLILGRGRFSGISNFVVKNSSKSKVLKGGGDVGRGGYVKKDLSLEEKDKSGSGIKKKLKPLKFKI